MFFLFYVRMKFKNHAYSEIFIWKLLQAQDWEKLI